jgi:hypothetical protein
MVVDLYKTYKLQTPTVAEFGEALLCLRAQAGTFLRNSLNNNDPTILSAFYKSTGTPASSSNLFTTHLVCLVDHACTNQSNTIFDQGHEVFSREPADLL